MREEVRQASLSRRGFLKAATASAAAVAGGTGSLLAGAGARAETRTARAGTPNPYVKGGKPLLVVVEGTDPVAMLAAGFDALGGAGLLVKKGTAVTLKPNQGLSTGQPYPTTIHPDTTFGLVKLLRQSGSGEVSICDSPTRPGAEKDLSFEKNGVFARGAAEGVPTFAYDNAIDENFIAVRDPRWKYMPEIRILRHLYDAPVVINLTTLKRHGVPGLTGPMKNHFGMVRGKDRRVVHDMVKSGSDGMRMFREATAEFVDAVRCEMAIIDARSIMIKGGPNLGGGPAEVKHNVNRMILSGSHMAAELYCVKLMAEHDDTFSAAMADGTLEHAERLGLGEADLKQVELIERTVA